MEIIYKDKKIKFDYSESADAWLGNISVGNYPNISIEIYTDNFKDKYIDWNLVTEFIYFIDTDLLEKLNIKSKILLLNFISTLGSHAEINDYRFELECLFYEGKVNTHFFSDEVFKYSLLYKIYKNGYEECFEPYSNYLICVENGLIMGFKKEQV
jgi:hypothetical protein